MRRHRAKRHQTQEWRFNRRARVLSDLARRGGVEVAVREGDGRLVYIYVPAPERRSRAAVVRHVADALADESPVESEDGTVEEWQP